MEQQLVDILRGAGFQGDALRTAYAVAMAESGGRATAFNGNRDTGDESYGLFQINMLGDLGPDRLKRYGLPSREALYDPQRNARIAYQMSGGGQNWQPWSAYKNGSYRQYLGGDQSAAVQAPAPSATSPAATSSSPAASSGMASAYGQQPSGGDPRTRLASMLLGRSMERRGRSSPALAQLLERRMQGSGGGAAAAAASPPAVAAPAAGAPRPPAMPAAPAAQGGAGIRELFYDPLGAYDEGNWINPIGGHSDHVHASFGDPQAALYGIRLANQMGLRASENPYAEGSPAEPGVHTDTSYHYRNFPGSYDGKQLGMGLDVSGSPDLMADYFKRLRQSYIGGNE